jgi:hypothetical protein
MDMKEIEYFERRAVSEAEMAQRAKCSAAVNAHREMSKAYFANAEALRQKLTLVAEVR